MWDAFDVPLNFETTFGFLVIKFALKKRMQNHYYEKQKKLPKILKILKIL
jgi:hypothetical protein